VSTPEDLYRKLGGHILWRSLAEVSRLLQRRGVGLSLLDSASLSAELVTRYMTIKQRQIL